MCKKNENQALLTKKEFVDIINRLHESSDLVDKVDTYTDKPVQLMELMKQRRFIKKRFIPTID